MAALRAAHRPLRGRARRARPPQRGGRLMLWNTVLLALRAIRRNVLRSFLTVLGIVIGVAAVITMVTLGDGATQSVKDQISSLGSNLLIVVPGQRFGPGATTAHRSSRCADVEAIRSQITAAERVAPMVSTAVTAVYQANNWSTVVPGTSESYFVSGNWRLAAGRTFTDDGGARRQGRVRDRRDRAREAVRPAEPGRQRDPRQAVRLRGDRPARAQGPVGDGLGPGRHGRHAAAHGPAAPDAATTDIDRHHRCRCATAPPWTRSRSRSTAPHARAPQHRRERGGRLPRHGHPADRRDAHRAPRRS